MQNYEFDIRDGLSRAENMLTGVTLFSAHPFAFCCMRFLVPGSIFRLLSNVIRIIPL
jgi:hypothetical protein